MLEKLYQNANIPLTRAFGVEYPEYFLSPAAEYSALVRSCGVIDLTHRRVLLVRGGGRARFLDAMLTNDAASLAPGAGCRSLLTAVDGKILSELFVHARAAAHIVVVSQGDFEETLAALSGEAAGEDVTLENGSAGNGIIGVEGPEAKRVMQRLLGVGPLPASALGVVEREFETFSVLVMQGSATGEGGFHVMAPAAEVARIREYLVQASRGSDGLPVGLSAWNARRVEAGLPWYGVDFAGEDHPEEVLLGAAVSSVKTSFRGREALLRPRPRGEGKRTLAGFVVEDDGSGEAAGRGPAGRTDAREGLDLRGLFPPGSPIHYRHEAAAADDRLSEESEPVGLVTSAVYSPALGKPLLMGRVGRERSGDLRDFFAVRTSRGMLPLRRIELPIAR